MLEAGREVITSAPNQNHENFRQRCERFIPIFAGIAFSRIQEYYSGREFPAIDMWNSFGYQMDSAYKRSPLAASMTRDEYATHLINEKYAFMQSLGVDIHNRQIIRDDSEETLGWMTEKLRVLFEQGIIYKDSEALSICAECQNIIAVAGVKVSGCSRCMANNIYVDRKESLFLDLTGDRSKYFEGKIALPRNSKSLNGSFQTLPARVMLPRVRDYGTPLDCVGFEGVTLDPKIGLSLMPEMVVESFGLESITQLQGIRTAVNTVPYTSILSPDIRANYILLNYLPSGITEEQVRTMGGGFFKKYLALFLLDKTGDVNPEQLAAVRTEYAKSVTKFNNAFGFLNNMGATEDVLDEEDAALLSQVFDNILRYRVREGVLLLRKFTFEVLGKKYPERVKKENRKLKDTDLAHVSRVASLIY